MAGFSVHKKVERDATTVSLCLVPSSLVKWSTNPTIHCLRDSAKGFDSGRKRLWKGTILRFPLKVPTIART